MYPAVVMVLVSSYRSSGASTLGCNSVSSGFGSQPKTVELRTAVQFADDARTSQKCTPTQSSFMRSPIGLTLPLPTDTHSDHEVSAVARLDTAV